MLASLRAYYGAGAVTEGPKSLKLAAAPGQLAAAITYKKFNYFLTDVLQSHLEGIRFHDRRDGSEIINYPKEHIKNGQEKNSVQRTNGNYKPTVRIFKNRISVPGDSLIESTSRKPQLPVSKARSGP